MEFLEKNVATELIELKDHTLEHVGLDGERQTYCPARSMWLKLEQLHVTQQLAEPLDADKQPTLTTSLHGVARLDGQELSIIGDAGHAMRTVDVSFAARDVSKADRLGLRELEDELGISFADVPLGTARLGANRADAETGEPDQWWLTCHIPEACIHALSKAMSDGHAQSSWDWRCDTSTQLKVRWLTLSASQTFFSGPTRSTAQLNVRKSRLATSPTFVLTSQRLNYVPRRRAAVAVMN